MRIEITLSEDGEVTGIVSNKETSINMSGTVPLLENDKAIFENAKALIKSLEQYCSNCSYHKSTISK